MFISVETKGEIIILVRKSITIQPVQREPSAEYINKSLIEESCLVQLTFNLCLNFQVEAHHKMEGWTVVLVVLTLASLHPVAQTSHIKVTKHAHCLNLREMWVERCQY